MFDHLEHFVNEELDSSELCPKIAELVCLLLNDGYSFIQVPVNRSYKDPEEVVFYMHTTNRGSFGDTDSYNFYYQLDDCRMVRLLTGALSKYGRLFLGLEGRAYTLTVKDIMEF